MNAVIFVLIVTANGRVAPTDMRFASLESCAATAVYIERASAEKSGMPYLKALCAPAKDLVK